jgi:hypothetical protein
MTHASHTIERRGRTLRSLSARSVHARHTSPADLVWPERLEETAWHMSPELVSLAGIEAFESLPESAQRRVAHLEAINFFSLNIHGERLLVEGIARRLYRDGDTDVSTYLHHMLDEESAHMKMFAEVCLRYHGALYPSRHVELPHARGKGEEAFLFFARIVVFEERVDYYNRTMAKDARLDPFVRRVHRAHHLDEVRHLAFGRMVVAELFERYAPTWSEETLCAIRAHLRGFMRASYGEYFNPDVYRDAGLAEPYALRTLAMASSASRAREARALERCASHFVNVGILASENEHVG